MGQARPVELHQLGSWRAPRQQRTTPQQDPGTPTTLAYKHTRCDVILDLFLFWKCFCPPRETVWWWFMGTHRRTPGCGPPEPVRWKVMASSVKGNKVWCPQRFSALKNCREFGPQREVDLNHSVQLCHFFRFRSAPSPGPYPCLPVNACWAGWSDLPGCGEASGLDRSPAPLWIFEWDPGHVEGSLPAGLPHTPDQQPAPARMDRTLQLWSEPVTSPCVWL